MKRILILLFLGLFSFSFPSCEGDESIPVQRDDQTVKELSGKRMLIAHVMPAAGFDIKFFRAHDAMVIESMYPKDATGELVDIIEGVTEKMSIADLYQKLAGDKLNLTYLKNIELVENSFNRNEKVNAGDVTPAFIKQSMNVERPVQNAIVVVPPPCLTENSVQSANRVCPSRSGQFLFSKCGTNVANFTSTHGNSTVNGGIRKDYIVRAQPVATGTGVKITAKRTLCHAACTPSGFCVFAGCFTSTTLDVDKTLPAGSGSVFQAIVRFNFSGGSTVSSATMVTTATGIGNCKLFHIGTAADRNPPL